MKQVDWATSRSASGGSGYWATSRSTGKIKKQDKKKGERGAIRASLNSNSIFEFNQAIMEIQGVH